jgi:solute carrier family 35 (UDP-sugar transporter), member A1/2/3
MAPTINVENQSKVMESDMGMNESSNGGNGDGSGGNNNGVSTIDDDSDRGTSSKAMNFHTFVSNPRNFKVILLIGMVLQNSLMVLVGRYSRTGVPKEELYVVNHLVLTIEVGKFILSCVAEFYHTSGNLMKSLETHVFKKPRDTLNSLVPALLYLLQNSLLYVALGNLTAPMFQVTYQGKLVTTAIVSVLLLNRTYNIQQWACLVVLSLGVAIVVLAENSDSSGSKKDANEQNLVLGLTCVTISCFSSAFAGVYFEKVLKTESKAGQVQQASLWMRNVQLSFFSVVIAAVQGGLFSTESSTTTTSPASTSYFHGFTFWVWVLVLLQSAGGLLVAAVMKYADNVLKGLATGVSVVVATTASIFLFATPITMQFAIGASLILGSAYYFSNPLPASVQKMVSETIMIKKSGPPSSSDPISSSSSTSTDESMKAFLPK